LLLAGPGRDERRQSGTRGELNTLQLLVEDHDSAVSGDGQGQRMLDRSLGDGLCRSIRFIRRGDGEGVVGGRNVGILSTENVENAPWHERRLRDEVDRPSRAG